jgi:hypothetical protein
MEIRLAGSNDDYEKVLRLGHQSIGAMRKNKCKSNDKNLDNASRLIEAALSGSHRKAPGSAGGYLHALPTDQFPTDRQESPGMMGVSKRLDCRRDFQMQFP